MTVIYKICPAMLWRKALAEGVFTGSPRDVEDGFIHCSHAEHLSETAQKYFRGYEELLLLTIDPKQLGDTLKYEPSRGGALFPHIYGPLPLAAVTNVTPFDVIE
jgi:uncharacterized protein (DUF952 family)